MKITITIKAALIGLNPETGNLRHGSEAPR